MVSIAKYSGKRRKAGGDGASTKGDGAKPTFDGFATRIPR